MSGWDTRAAQRVIGNVLIPSAREQQSTLLPESESLPLALELYWTALATKPAYQQAGLIVARRFAERMGLNSEQVRQFAVQSVVEAIAEATP